MKIISSLDRNTWNAFVAKNSSPSSLLQSWEWGEFEGSLGHSIHRFAVTDESGDVVAVAQVIVKPIYFGKTYLEVPRGPVYARFDKNVCRVLLEHLQLIGKKENAVLARLSPPYEAPGWSELGLKRPQILMRQKEPDDTLLMDATKDPEEILSHMPKKGRYGIKTAEKANVVIVDATDNKAAFETFFELLSKTFQRNKITSWPKERFDRFREYFFKKSAAATSNESPRAILLAAELEGKMLASAVIAFFGDAGTYLYAASRGEEGKANAPSRMLWEGLILSHNLEKRWYDFWGLAPKNQRGNHLWSGFTNFKEQFVRHGVTGKEFNYTGTWDYIINRPLYVFFQIMRGLRKITKFFK